MAEFSPLRSHAQVVIVGAGPVGLLTALRLGQAGIDTIVIEGHDTLLETTRAVVYMPVVIPALEELGILDKVMKEAYLNTEGISWRDLSGKSLATLPLDSSNSDEFGGGLILGQYRMGRLILEEVKKYPSVAIRFGLKLTSLADDPSSPHVQLTARDTTANTTTTQPTDVHLTSTFVLGTDGANSTTRKLLGLTHDGFTYTDTRIIGTDILHDFIHHENFAPLNFIVHPTDWAVIAHTGQLEGGLHHNHTTTHPDPNQPSPRPQWRVAYPEPSTLPTDPASILSRAHTQMHKYIKPGTPFEIVRAEPYTISQRHASSPCSATSRVFLAGDALHTNNPIGGLGLTSGIRDAFSFGNALVRAIANREGSDVVRECAYDRLRVWTETTDRLSQANLERLRAPDESEHGVARRAFFDALNGKAGDDVKRATIAKVRGGLDGLAGRDFGEGVNRLVERL